MKKQVLTTIILATLFSSFLALGVYAYEYDVEMIEAENEAARTNITEDCCEAIELYRYGEMTKKAAMDVCGASNPVEFNADRLSCNLQNRNDEENQRKEDDNSSNDYFYGNF